MIEAEINETLDNFLKDERYCLVESLKNTESERTEKIFLPAENQYFIRKYIRPDDSMRDSRDLLYGLLINSDITQVAKVFETYYLADELVVIMEYVEGPSLYEYVRRSGQLPMEIIKTLIEDVLIAVKSLHNLDGKTIIHRDITPSNIVVYQDESRQVRAKVIDFGISRVFIEGKTKDTRHLGTIGFAAPEQYGFGQTSVRSDVYALGAILFFCLTGKNPTNNLLDTLMSEKNISNPLKALIAKAMSIDPGKRHASVEEFRLDFDSSISPHFFNRILLKHLVQKPEWSGLQKKFFHAHWLEYSCLPHIFWSYSSRFD